MCLGLLNRALRHTCEYLYEILESSAILGIVSSYCHLYRHTAQWVYSNPSLLSSIPSHFAFSFLEANIFLAVVIRHNTIKIRWCMTASVIKECQSQ